MRTIYILLLSLLISLSAFSQATLSTSLTACYTLDGNANDPINFLTGNLSAVTPTVNRFGALNSAMAFNGTTSSFIQLPNSPLLKANAVSFSCWAKTNSPSTPYQYIVFTTNGCFSYYEGYELAFQNVGTNAYKFQLAKSSSSCSSGGQIILTGSTTTITANSWVHVGFYAGPDSLKLYVNGMLDGALANSNPLTYGANTNVYLGGNNQTPNQPFNGSLDNVRFYNRKLSGTEFNQLYALDPICQPQPVATFSPSPYYPCVNQTVSLIGVYSNSPTTFSWLMPGGTPSVSSIANPTVTYTSAGIYSITQTASNAYGTTAPVTKTVNVSTCIGIQELSSDPSLKVYPNPFTNEFSISGLESSSEIKVYNALGSLILNKTTNEETEKVNLGLQPQGIYIVRVFSKGKYSTLKMIKE